MVHEAGLRGIPLGPTLQNESDELNANVFETSPEAIIWDWSILCGYKKIHRLDN